MTKTKTPTVYEKYRPYFSWQRHDGQFGLEFETETNERYDYPEMSFWRCVPDGSLRNFGVEYILKAPMSCPDIQKAFDEWDKLDFEFLRDQITTSSHVHINVLNETCQTVANFLVVYTIVENMLIKMSGEDRHSNLFCLPIKDAEASLSNISTMLKGLSNKKPSPYGLSFSARDCKYAALNLASFGSLGSLEIRSFRGITKTSEISSFLDCLNNLLTFSRQDIIPSDIFKMFQEDKAGLVSSALGKEAVEKTPDWETLVDRNQWYLAKLSSISDWKYLKDSSQKGATSPSLMELDQAAQESFGTNYNQLSSSSQRSIINFLEQRLLETTPPTGENDFEETLEDL